MLTPNAIAAGFFAEEVRRELLDRYGEKKLYEGGLSVRTTLDPKLQLMARKALVDGLVRYDEAHGWHGVVKSIDLGQDWGVPLGRHSRLRRHQAVAARGRARRHRHRRSASACSRTHDKSGAIVAGSRRPARVGPTARNGPTGGRSSS